MLLGAVGMIESIRFKNFKVLRDTTLPLGRFTLIVGPNGSGKSTVFQALQAANSRCTLTYSRIVSAGISPPEPVAVVLRWASPWPGLEYTFRWTPEGEYRGEAAVPPGDNAVRPTYEEATRRFRFYALDPRAIQAATKI